MRTIALRFCDNFAPKEGTISAHEKMIETNGYVWYGKLGSRLSAKTAESIMTNDIPRILLIHSGAADRYWAYIDKIQNEIPNRESIPTYYRNNAEDFKCWFRIIKFEKASRDVLSKCYVASSNAQLTFASKQSMSPFFIIDFHEDD